MGMGKTVSVLTALDRLDLSGSLTGPTLILAPLRVARDVWPAEAKEWEHLKHMTIVPIVGTARERLDALHQKASVYTCNYENLVWLIETWGVHWPYTTIVLDESTKVKSLRANIRKNADGTEWVQGQGGARAKALLKTMHTHKVPRTIELSGTPSPNGLEDLWGQLFYLDYGKRLGRVFDAFRQRWFRPNFDGFGYEVLPHAQKEIQETLKDVCLSIRSEDHFDLKEPIVRTIEVELPTAARKAYRELEKTLYTEISMTPVEVFNSGAKTQKLLQFCAGAAYTGHADDPGPRKWIEVHQEKLNALDEVIEEAAGEPVLVAYHFKSDLERILARFKFARHLDQKSQTLADWNAGKIKMLCAHPASAGHGLNMQHGGSRLVYFSHSWNFEERSQIAERIGCVRQLQSGYKRNCFIYNIVVKSSLEGDVLDALENKRSVQDALMAGLRRRLSS